VRLTVIHWRPEEAADAMERLRSLGFDTQCMRPEGGNLAAVRNTAPDAFVIDLTRLPSHGTAVGAELRKSRAVRHIPIVFAGGLPEKVQRARSVLPEALFCTWDNIEAALLEAATSPPAPAPKPGGYMTAYAGTPVAKKLGIMPGSVLTVTGAPDEYPECLNIPDSVTVHRHAGHPSDRVLVFVDRAAQLDMRFAAAERSVSDRGNIWIIWPKQASGMATDVNQHIVRATGLERGWVDYKVCSVDKVWSGFCFGRKRK
jgi:hypothetical protein